MDMQKYDKAKEDERAFDTAVALSMNFVPVILTVVGISLVIIALFVTLSWLSVRYTDGVWQYIAGVFWIVYITLYLKELVKRFYNIYVIYTHPIFRGAIAVNGMRTALAEIMAKDGLE